MRMGRLDPSGGSTEAGAAVEAPVTMVSKSFFTGVDHHRRQDLFATSGGAVELWSSTRSEPMSSYSWGADTISTVKFNPVEVNVLASAADDRAIALYDVRADTPVRKVVLAMRTNALCWNPMEAFNFTAANEDGNCYTFDMRKLDRALNVHKDHVSAVMSVDYSPTGREFVTGGYDKTIRIFGVSAGHSREVYHTRRMQRIFSVVWSADAKFVLSGSDEMIVRLWKADAAEHLGTMAARQRAARNYDEALKARFKHHPEIRRIARHRRLPKEVYAAGKAQKAQAQAAKKRVENAHRNKSVKGGIERKAERTKSIVREAE